MVECVSEDNFFWRKVVRRGLETLHQEKKKKKKKGLETEKKQNLKTPKDLNTVIVNSAERRQVR